ncbi:MAG TPA: hypothetical protein VFQ26_05645, partial [Nitrospiraceae bacterium]|nr:hypothetical protein [Nitrospiraceae bacterium]
MSLGETTHRSRSSELLPPPSVNTAPVEASGLLDLSIALTEPAAEQDWSRESPVGFAPAEISVMIHREIVSRHAEEAAFLWQLRDRAVVAPHYSLADLVNW